MKLIISNLLNERTGSDSLDVLIVTRNSGSHTVDTELLDRLLQKCPKITEIYINFSKRVSDNRYSIDGQLFEVLISSGIQLKKFTICSKVENLTESLIQRFAEKFRNSLTHLRVKYLSDRHLKQLFRSTNTFRNLLKLDFNTINRELNEDLLKFFTTKQLFPKLNSLKYTFSGFDGYKLVTDPDFTRLKTLDIVLDTEFNPELTGQGVNRALLELSQLKSLQIFNIKIFTEDTVITAIDEGLRRMANNCLHLKRIDFIMDSIVLNGKLFDVFSNFKTLEFCEISIEFNEDLEDYGLIEWFGKCSSLRVFNLYLYNICDKHLVDIDLYIPNITNFHLKSKTGITDKTLDYLKRCPKLEVFEIHTYDDQTTRIQLSDSGISQLIRNCPKLRYVLLFSRQKCLGFERSIEELIQRAKDRPKVRHCFGSSSVLDLCKRLAFLYKNSVKTVIHLPPNLNLMELPDWKRITSYDFYVNQPIPGSNARRQAIIATNE